MLNLALSGHSARILFRTTFYLISSKIEFKLRMDLASTSSFALINHLESNLGYGPFSVLYVERDDMEKTVDTLSTLWTYDEYDYKLVYKGIKSTVGTHGTVTYNERKYTVIVDDDSYTVTLSYIDDEGLVGFNMQF